MGEGIVSDQGDSVTTSTITVGTGVRFEVRQDLIEDLVVMREDVVLQIMVIFTDLTTLETLGTSLVIVTLHNSAGYKSSSCAIGVVIVKVTVLVIVVIAVAIVLLIIVTFIFEVSIDFIYSCKK